MNAGYQTDPMVPIYPSPARIRAMATPRERARAWFKRAWYRHRRRDRLFRLWWELRKYLQIGPFGEDLSEIAPPMTPSSSARSED
jgi:hypothetical protein